MRILTLACAVALALAASARAENAAPPAQPPAPAQTQTSAALDELFARLAATEDPDEAAGVVALIDRLHRQSGSDTGDLLMARAIATMEARDYSISRSLLDAIVDLRPDWAEAWSRRATARYLSGDPKGAMADLAQALARDPRHLQALTQLAAILEDAGLKEQALSVDERALAIAPHWRPLVEAAARLKAALAGQAL